MIEGGIVITFVHLLIAGAVFTGIVISAVSVFLIFKLIRFQQLKRRVKVAEDQQEIAEEGQRRMKIAFADYKARAQRAVERAMAQQEIAQIKAGGADSRIEEERDASSKILDKLEHAFNRNDKAFQTILDQQTKNAAMIGDTIVKVTKEAGQTSIIENHYGLDKNN